YLGNSAPYVNIGGGCPCPTTSCEAQGKDCGTLFNGCKALKCGSHGGGCPNGQACGAGGPDGVCAPCWPGGSLCRGDGDCQSYCCGDWYGECIGDDCTAMCL